MTEAGRDYVDTIRPIVALLEEGECIQCRCVSAGHPPGLAGRAAAIDFDPACDSGGMVNPRILVLSGVGRESGGGSQLKVRSRESVIAGASSSDSAHLFAWSLLALLGIIWGTNFLFMKMAVAVIPPLEVAWMRTIFGALPIAMFALARRSLNISDWRHGHHFAAMALLANVGPYVFFVIGTSHLPSGVAGVISGSIPFVTAAIVAVALPAEHLTRAKIIGLAVGFAGILLVAPLGQGAAPAGGGTPLLGVLAMLAGSVSYALALVYARKFVTPLNLGPVRLATYQMLLAVLLLAPFAAPGHWTELMADGGALLALVFGLGLVGTGIAFVIYYQLIQSLGAMKAASVYYIPPVVALLVGWAFAGEAITLVQAIGAALVMAGIFYANRR